MMGKIYITRHGYDPQRGKYIKDPYLGDVPTMGACRPDFRKKLVKGDHIFMISGGVTGYQQFVVGGFEIAEKITAAEAYQAYPEQRLHRLNDGQLAGNVIVDENGNRHPLDNHRNFPKRIENYVVGCNLLKLESDAEIDRGRKETLEVLQDILKKKGKRPFDIIGKAGVNLNESQIVQFRDWLQRIKNESL